MPTLLIIAGPNGAGKTTFANRYLSNERSHWQFVNADEIARTLPDGDRAQLDIRAGRAMLEQIDALIAANADFAVETTLASRSYARKIPDWRRDGYVVSLCYLRLPTVEHALARVRNRVQAGGHGIPQDTIRRRFDRSLRYLEALYKPAVDEWTIWDSLDGDFMMAEASADDAKN